MSLSVRGVHPGVAHGAFVGSTNGVTFMFLWCRTGRRGLEVQETQRVQGRGWLSTRLTEEGNGQFYGRQGHLLVVLLSKFDFVKLILHASSNVTLAQSPFLGLTIWKRLATFQLSMQLSIGKVATFANLDDARSLQR